MPSRHDLQDQYPIATNRASLWFFGKPTVTTQLRPFHQQIRSPGADFGWSSVDVRTSERPLERSSWPLAGDPGSDSALALAVWDLLHDGTWLCLKMGYCSIASIA